MGGVGAAAVASSQHLLTVLTARADLHRYRQQHPRDELSQTESEEEQVTRGGGTIGRSVQQLVDALHLLLAIHQSLRDRATTTSSTAVLVVTPADKALQQLGHRSRQPQTPFQLPEVGFRHHCRLQKGGHPQHGADQKSLEQVQTGAQFGWLGGVTIIASTT